MAPSFKIGINMAGAISAGAYTAGVLDFLTEALDAWYQAKARGEQVPSHDISIEVFSGASAGGMCAAISSVLLQEDFEHIHDTTRKGTTNRFYESWVNRIDIREMLKTDDLKRGVPLVSLLDSTIIATIAEYALTSTGPLPPPRPYVSPNLTLLLSLTNLRGVPYSLNGAAPGSLEETTFFYGDRIRFETIRADTTRPPARTAHTIDLAKPGAAGGWDLLQTAAMATGAFPIFLAPRELPRKVDDYTPPLWESVTSAIDGTPPPIPPNFPPKFGATYNTLNVDGGVTNNDPFNYAHDYLAALNPPSPCGKNRQSPLEADRAVISIAPFPTTDKFDPRYTPAKQAGIFTVLPKLFGALISQSRFFGESLTEIMTGETFSRFVIAPSDDTLVKHHEIAGTAHALQPTALQCATLGAFGGFFERGFRAHDYALGRRNCQKFLESSFLLPRDNPLHKASLDALAPASKDAILQNFGRPAPGTYAHTAKELEHAGAPVPHAHATAGQEWLPIIPLCGKAVSDPLPPVPRAQITDADLDTIVNLILKQRFRSLVPLLLADVPGVIRFVLSLSRWWIPILAKRPLKRALIQQLGDAYKP